MRKNGAPNSERGHREVRAGFDGEGVYVYQAFNEATARRAVELGTFGEGFGFHRYTWIKPSLGWMLYRSGFASKKGQERILRIKISHDSFQFVLRKAVSAIYDSKVYSDVNGWRLAQKRCDLRYQWDPERDLSLNSIDPVKALQIGIGPCYSRIYVKEWIMGIKDVTESIRKLKSTSGSDRANQALFVENLYDISHDARLNLGIEVAGGLSL